MPPASTPTPLRISAVRRSLLGWYRAHARPFPWRRTRDPYRILVSEIMLQQTQAARVQEKYPAFIRRFPSLRRLSAARTSEVIRAWQGMGYNNRAVNLHKAAREIVEIHQGRIPSSPPLLLCLPGLGPYTANAVACFAFGATVAPVDTNIRRVLSRLFPSAAKRMDIRDLAERALPRRSAYDWNQGLMELGARVCTARAPSCSDCPLRRLCPSAHRTKPTPQAGSSEAGRNGVPNRIYRGRIVEVLRRSRSPLTVGALSRQAVPDLKRGEAGWLRRILDSLRTDGVVSVRLRRGRTYVALAD